MKVFLYTLITICSFPLLAAEEILRGLNAINSQEMDCSKMSESELLTQCAHQVCGPPQKKSIRVKAQDASKYLSPKNYQHLQKLEQDLTKYYSAQKNDLSKLADEFKKRQKSNEFLSLSDWKEEDFAPLVDMFFQKVTLDVDYGLPPEKRVVKLLTARDDPHFSLHQEILKDFNPTKDPLRAFNIGIITQEEFKTLIINQSRNYEAKLTSLNKKSNFSHTQFSFQISSGVNDKNSLVKIYQNMHGKALNDGIHLTPNLCHHLCKREIVKFIKETDPDKIKKNADDALTSLPIEDRIALCKGAFLSAHIENTRRDEFQKMWPAIKQNFVSNVFPRFSKHSQQLLEKYLNEEINFFYTDPYQTKFEDVSNSLDIKNTSYHNMPNNQLASKAIVLLEDGNLFRQDCSSERNMASVWDAFASKEFLASKPAFRPQGLILNKDNIAISPFSCEHQGAGKGIIAHEIGHALSHVMARPGMSKGSAKTYLGLRKCVTDKWENNPSTIRGYHKGDKRYTEEDTADLISYMAIKDASDPFGCVLLYPDDTQYSTLGTTPILGDNHTPAMIRLLRELEYKAPNRIPATCNELIKRNKNKIGKKCI